MPDLSPPISTDPIAAFVARWTPAEQAERTDAAAILIELCDLLSLTRPESAQGGGGPCRFERSVRVGGQSK